MHLSSKGGGGGGREWGGDLTFFKNFQSNSLPIDDFHVFSGLLQKDLFKGG